MGEVFVLIRETGEYSDRLWDPIGYVGTEEEARQAVERLDREGRTRYDDRPKYPKRLATHGYFDPTGAEWEWNMASRRPDNVVYRKRDDHDERVAQNEAALAVYNEAVAAMGCLDPEGPHKDATYSYSRVARTYPTES